MVVTGQWSWMKGHHQGSTAPYNKKPSLTRKKLHRRLSDAKQHTHIQYVRPQHTFAARTLNRSCVVRMTTWARTRERTREAIQSLYRCRLETLYTQFITRRSYIKKKTEKDQQLRGRARAVKTAPSGCGGAQKARRRRPKQWGVCSEYRRNYNYTRLGHFGERMKTLTDVEQDEAGAE